MTEKNKPGSYVEAKMEHINDGKMKADFDALMQRAFRELSEYLAETHESKGKASFSLVCTIEQNTNEFVSLDYELGLKTPKRKSTAMVRGAGGKLLAHPDTDSLNDNDQMLLPTFDRFGTPRATINQNTGEVIDDDDPDAVAGSIAGVG